MSNDEAPPPMPPIPSPRPPQACPPRPLRLAESQSTITKVKMTPTPTSDSFKDGTGRKISMPVLESEEDEVLLRSDRGSHAVRRVASGVSITASTPRSPGRRTPTTASSHQPSTLAVTTDDSDDSDDSYQSAYSAVSPQDGDFLALGASESDFEVGYERPSPLVHSHALPHDPMEDFGLKRLGKMPVDITVRPPTRERTMSAATATARTNETSPTLTNISSTSTAGKSAHNQTRPSRRYWEMQPNAVSF